jgi:hypothetical protein
MTNPSNSAVQNLLPVQAYFNLDGSFNTFIGQGTPFYATANPVQSGLTITNSTLNSSPIGGTSPSTGVFTNIATTTGTITTAASGPTDIVNKQYVDYFAAGLSWKAPALTGTSANITLSGLQTINGVTVVAGDTVLVKNQTNAAENGIYIASSGAWTYSVGGDTWAEYIGAIIFISSGSLNGTAWYCTAQPGGTLGVTAMNWSNFSVASTYTAGTGLQLIGTQFSIANTGVSAATYGSATASAVIAVNAQGQITSASSSTITPAVGSITGLGTGVATALAVNVGSVGSVVVNGGALGTPSSGTLTNCTFPTLNQNTTGYAAGIAGGAAGSVPYQTAANTTTFLPVGSNGQVLTLAAGVPSWATPTTGTVTSVGGTGTVSGISLSGTVTSSGNLTLGGTLDLSAPPAIGGTTANTIRGTTITATTGFVGPYYDAATSAGGALRNASGTAQIQWGAGGGSNVTIDVSTNLNGTNAQIDISPTGTGHVHINPTGSGSIEMNPTSAGTMNNMVIGGTTPLAGTFTTLRFNSTLSLNGSTGTANYLLQSNGASAPSWVNPATLTVSAASTATTATTATNATNVGVTDDTTTATTCYPSFVTNTTGNLPIKVSSTKLNFVPSTGVLTSTSFTGAATGLTGTASININGTVGATTPSSGKFTYGYSPNITLTDAATIAWDTSTGQVATFTFVSSNRTMGAPTNLVNGGFYALAVIQNSGSNTLTWNSVFKWASGTAPTLSTAAGAKDYFTFRSDGTNLYQQGSSLGVA